MGVTEYGTFAEVRARLDEILVEVRKKDLSLEKSLDLYEEAIKLGNRCAELVDKPDFSAREAEEALAAMEGEGADAAGEEPGEGGEAVGEVGAEDGDAASEGTPAATEGGDVTSEGDGAGA